MTSRNIDESLKARLRVQAAKHGRSMEDEARDILRTAPEHRVMAWLDEQPRASIFTSAVTQGEILYGIRLLPDGQRRKKLWDAAVAVFTDDFSGRVLSFDEDAATNYAEVAASRRAAGRPISQFDGVIASNRSWSSWASIVATASPNHDAGSEPRSWSCGIPHLVGPMYGGL